MEDLIDLDFFKFSYDWLNDHGRMSQSYHNMSGIELIFQMI